MSCPTKALEEAGLLSRKFLLLFWRELLQAQGGQVLDDTLCILRLKCLVCRVALLELLPPVVTVRAVG